MPLATTYAYDGMVYDRFFLGRLHPRAGRVATQIRLARRTAAAAGPPYTVVDPYAQIGLYGTALAINNSGDIAYWYDDDYDYLCGDPEVIHDDASYTFLGEPYVDRLWRCRSHTVRAQ